MKGSVVLTRVTEHVQQCFSGRWDIWEHVPVQSLMESGAFLALSALESALFREDMDRISAGKKPRHGSVREVLAREIQALNQASKARLHAGEGRASP